MIASSAATRLHSARVPPLRFTYRRVRSTITDPIPAMLNKMNSTGSRLVVVVVAEAAMSVVGPVGTGGVAVGGVLGGSLGGGVSLGVSLGGGEMGGDSLGGAVGGSVGGSLGGAVGGSLGCSVGGWVGGSVSSVARTLAGIARASTRTARMAMSLFTVVPFDGMD
jgi:hypothetical protein